MRVLLALLFLLPATSRAATPEEEYWAMRTALIEKLKGAENAEDQAGLARLEPLLRTAVGPVNVAGFSGDGKINLETLNSEVEIGFGQADGLAFRNQTESLFVTTRNLLELYLDRPQLDLAGVASEGFYQQVFSSDAAVEFYAAVQVRSAEGNPPAEAQLGMVAQDTGPWPPDRIFIFVPKGDRILMVVAVSKLPQIAMCEKWNSDADHSRYIECYIEGAKKQGLLASVQEQAQSIVDRLQK